jgi:NAD(P)-dependent dehydrogenase (short-subunit alcohol dehydrogenase family)
MTSTNTWFITGAGRGMGVEFARAALAAGHNVVATGRDPDTITEAVGEHEQLLVVKLDITSPQQAEQAVKAAVERFGRIDVLVNNAANFFAGFFEELWPQQVDTQIQTNLVGPMTVTRAVLPVMRNQRSGHMITISSVAGLLGQEFCSAYAAAKFGLEGWMESLAPELAHALITITDHDEPPLRWVAGADAVSAAEQKAKDLLAQVDAYRELSSSLAHDDIPAVA